MHRSDQANAPESLQALGETVAKFLPILDLMGAQLRETAVDIEKAVVGVCGNFQQMAARAQSSVSQASQFLGRGTGGEGAGSSFDKVADRARSTMQALLRRSGEAKTASKRAVDLIQAITKATDSITSSLARLDDISLGNRLLSVNARIQAVNASHESGGFNAVAAEIASQARQSTEIVEGIRSLVDDLNGIAAAATAELKTMADTDERLFETSQREVEDALREFRGVHMALEEMLTNMASESRIVTHEIEAAVRALQFQDRVNQRIGHIVEELGLLYTELREKCPIRSELAEAALAAFSSRFTMHEEWRLLSGGEQAAQGGEIELF